MSRAGPFVNAVKTLCNLANALLLRSDEFGQPEDIKSSIEHLRHLRGFPLDSFHLPRTVDDITYPGFANSGENRCAALV
jgi:hypothetical protein